VGNTFTHYKNGVEETVDFNYVLLSKIVILLFCN